MATSDGHIILLNGASSSGKTTIARQLQSRIDLPFWHFSIDHLRDSGVLPLDRIHSGEFAWSNLRAGFFEGFHQSLAVYAGAGNNLIVEHIVENEQWLSSLVGMLQPFDVFCVAIHCPLPELERREAQRGDRRLGGARRDFDSIHNFMRYDFEVDSTISSAQAAEQVLAAWNRRSSPSVFDQLTRS